MLINLNRLPPGSINAKNLCRLTIIALNLADQCLNDGSLRFSSYSTYFGETKQEMVTLKRMFLNAIDYRTFNGIGTSVELFNKYVASLDQARNEIHIEELPVPRPSL